MSCWKSSFWFFFALLTLSISVVGQGVFRGSNLMEFQLGNIPQLEPNYQSSLYNQLNLSYRYKSFGANARIEQYYPSFGTDNDYRKVSQFSFQYRSDLLEVQFGNIYQTLGRGLLLRTYEIPASIWETRGYRVRYGFYKDFLGASVKLSLGNLELQAIRGEVLDVTLPPTIEDAIRRPDLIEGLQSTYKFKNQSAGVILMRHIAGDQAAPNANSPDLYASAFFDGLLFNSISLYGEVARKLNDQDFYAFDNESAYGGYLGVNFFLGNFGISAEYKDYQNFALGTGINDPPTLVKEHSYRVLNRSTHVPIITDESGYQLEIYYTFENGNMLTFNTSRAKNVIAEDRVPIFQEYFTEYQFYPSEKTAVKVFFDYSKDPFVNEDNRYAAGGALDYQHTKLTSTVEFEYQHIRRETFSGTDIFANYYFGYTLAKGSKMSLSSVVELTYDPIQIFDNKSYNLYPSLTGTFQVNPKNKFILFAGKRRGGPSCNSGVCYDVLDFEGVELRINSRI